MRRRRVTLPRSSQIFIHVRCSILRTFGGKIPAAFTSSRDKILLTMSIKKYHAAACSAAGG